jgi:hypothetical protein
MSLYILFVNHLQESEDRPGVPAKRGGQLCGPFQPGGGEKFPAPSSSSLLPGSTYPHAIPFFWVGSLTLSLAAHLMLHISAKL